MKVLYLTNVPTPYKTGMLNALAADLPDLRVGYLASSDGKREWIHELVGANHSYTFFRSHEFRPTMVEGAQYLSLGPIVACCQRDVVGVIAGPYSQLPILFAILICRLRGIRSVLWYESTEMSSTAPGLIKRVGRAVKRLLFKAVDVVVVPGTLARASALQLGISDDKVIIGGHAVDNDFFLPMAADAHETRLMRSFLFHTQSYERVLVYVGQDIDRKNIKALVDAFVRSRPELGSCCLVLIGVGPSAEKPPQHVFRMDFVQRDDLRAILSRVDGLVLPSLHEVWGLVVNEALACGVPVLVSDRCGAKDLVIEGVNGFVFAPTDPGAIDSSLREWGRRVPFERTAVRDSVVHHFNFKRMADTFVTALNVPRR